MTRPFVLRAAGVLACLMPAFAAAAAFAQADPGTVADTERVKAETEHYKAETAREAAMTERIKAENDRIAALGLPRFEGKTELGSNAGAMEATLLSARALGAAATAIANEPMVSRQAKLLVLTRDEVLDMSEATAIQFEMDTIRVLYDNAKVPKPAPPDKLLGGSVLVPAIAAAAGMLRSDATLSFVDASAIDDRMFVWAVAAALGDKAVLPGAFIGSTIGTEGKKMFDELNILAQRRLTAGTRRDALAAKKTLAPAEKAELAALTTAITRHDAFLTRVTTPSEKGVVPFVAAARVKDLLGNNYPVLRLHVDKAGGSLVNTKNLATTFGIDPLKVSGGVIASYLLTDPSTGAVSKADVLSCHTTLTSIRRIQERRWSAPSGLCVSALTYAVAAASPPTR